MGDLTLQRGSIRVNYGEFSISNGTTTWNAKLGSDGTYYLTANNVNKVIVDTTGKMSVSTRLLVGSTGSMAKTLSVGGTGQFSETLRVGSNSTASVDATFVLDTALGGFNRLTQWVGSGSLALNLMNNGSTWNCWGIDASNRWNITTNSTSFNTTGLMISSAGDVGLNIAPSSSYKLYVGGNMRNESSFTGQVSMFCRNTASSGSNTEAVIGAISNAGATTLGASATSNSAGAGADYEILSGGSSYLLADPTNGLAIMTKNASSSIKILTGGVKNSNIRCKISNTGTWAFNYGDNTSATEVIQIKNGNIKLDGSAGTHGMIFPDATKQYKAINRYTTSFTDATLSAGILTVTHSLGTKYNHVTVYNNSDVIIVPTLVTATSTSVTTIDLTGFGTLTGTWNVVITQ